VQDSHVLDDRKRELAGSCFVDFVSATGRGSAEPVEVTGKEDRSLSRRVVFKIRVKSLEQRGLETKLGLSNLRPVVP
jgi:hypothetical protein